MELSVSANFTAMLPLEHSVGVLVAIYSRGKLLLTRISLQRYHLEPLLQS